MVLEEYWTLKEGLELIRALQGDCRPFGYHLCLGGGVLNKGESKKDIDLFFLPLDNGKECEAQKLLAWLQSLWGEGVDLQKSTKPDRQGRIVTDVQGRQRVVWDVVPAPDYPPSPNYLYKWKFFRSGMRIDTFILEGKAHDRPRADEGVEGDRAGTPVGRAGADQNRQAAGREGPLGPPPAVDRAGGQEGQITLTTTATQGNVPNNQIRFNQDQINQVVTAVHDRTVAANATRTRQWAEWTRNLTQGDEG